jgi:hypothetical protein
MRRKSNQSPFPDWKDYSVLDDVDKEQLQLIGAICLEWNFIEDMIDYALFQVLELEYEPSLEVTSRINGMDGKLEILRKAAQLQKKFPEPYLKVIGITTGGVEEHKRYRDGVVHVRLLDPTSEVAPTSIRRGKSDEVLISKPALQALYARLAILAEETLALGDALGFTFLDGEDCFDPTRAEASECFQAYFAQVQEHQKHRQSLPPLPKFPDSPPTPPTSEAGKRDGGR